MYFDTQITPLLVYLVSILIIFILKIPQLLGIN